MNAMTSSVKIGDKVVDLPVKTGTIGPSVVDIGKLYAQTEMFTFDPGFTSTASCESQITYIDGRQGRPALSRLSDRADRRTRRFPGDLLPAVERRASDHAAEDGFRLPRHAPHDGARADGPLFPGLPSRRASDGGDGCLRRRAVGVLSRLDPTSRIHSSA